MSINNEFRLGVETVLEVVIFENWIRFYFISENPDQKDSLIVVIPEKAAQRISERYPNFLALAESMNGKEIDFETSRQAICTHVFEHIDGKTIGKNMGVTIFASITFQTEMQLFNSWVQTHESQLDKKFFDFGAWKELFAKWRKTDEVESWATQINTAPLKDLKPKDNKEPSIQ